MRHRLPYLQDDQKAADDLRQLRWPEGVTCPRGGSDAVELRERCDHGLQRCNGVPCAVRLGQQGARCTAWSSAIFAESQWRPLAWWRVIGLGQLQRNATAIAPAADIQARTAPRWSNVLEGGLYEPDHRAPSRPLENPGEADECSQSAGSKGLPRAGERPDRAPRPRGLQRRGRATAEQGRPPMRGLGQRRDKTDPDAPAAPVYLAVLEHVRTATINPLIAAQVQGGTPFFTDAYNLYHCTAAAYDQRTVNHGAGAYARRDPDGVWGHGNTMEGLWSGLRNFLDRFTGISQRFLHLRVARYEFLPNHGRLPWRQTFAATLRSIFSPTGDYLRQMAPQHRRIPLTLCYR